MSKQFLSEKETKTLYQKACGVFGGESKRLKKATIVRAQTWKLMIIDGVFNIISDDNSPENFETFLETVNRNLKPLYMEIRRGVSEEDGSNNYGLVWNFGMRSL